MAVYQKIGGVWVEAQRPYLKVGNVWMPCREVYRKNAGNWQLAYQYDITPPNPPMVEMSIVENNAGGRWIRVGVRTTGVNNDPDLKRIRVLTTYENAMPSTQYGGTYTSKSDTNWPDEPWSEWRYNSFGAHTDSSVASYKQWPVNPGRTTELAGGRDYHFAAWSEDDNGNWSVGTFARIKMPKKGVDAPNIVVKEARFNANSSGSYGSGGFTAGNLVQQANPLSRGLWFHGNKITEAIGKTGAPTIRNAQIRVERMNDNGVATANVYLFRHEYQSPGELPGSPTFNGSTKIGTINKGESKWFSIPESYFTHFNSSIKGFGLSHKDPAKATAFPEDYTVIQSTTDSLRSGEVHVVWEESL